MTDATARPPRAQNGSIIAKVLALLDTHPGGLTQLQLVYLVDTSRSSLGKTLLRLCNEAMSVRRLHIHHWENELEGARDYPRPVFVKGPGANAKKPAPKPRRLVVSDWYMKNSMRNMTASVFNPVAVRRAIYLMKQDSK